MLSSAAPDQRPASDQEAIKPFQTNKTSCLLFHSLCSILCTSPLHVGLCGLSTTRKSAANGDPWQAWIPFFRLVARDLACIATQSCAIQSQSIHPKLLVITRAPRPSTNISRYTCSNHLRCQTRKSVLCSLPRKYLGPTYASR